MSATPQRQQVNTVWIGSTSINQKFQVQDEFMFGLVFILTKHNTRWGKLTHVQPLLTNVVK